MKNQHANTLRRAVAFVALALLVAACGTTTPPQPSVSDVTIVGGDRTVGVGLSEQLTATVTGTNGASEEVTWSSSAEGTATVSATGLLTGVATGTAEITATSVEDATVNDTIVVTVVEVAGVVSVVIDGGDRTVAVGLNEQLTATVTAADGISEEVTWSSSAEGTATVSATGLLTGVATGTAEITATSVEDPTVNDTIVVTVIEAAGVVSVVIDGGDRNLQLWDDAQLTATVVVTGGASQQVTWSSDDPAVTVSASGLVEAVAADATATITATSVADPTVSGSIEVTVAALPAPDLNNVFVDANVPAGGNGSASFPLQTISAGIDLVNAAGTVNVAAGSYAESLHITKSLDLIGAGVGLVTIEASADAPGIFSEAAIDLENVDGVTLSGFRLDVVEPGPTLAAIGMMYQPGSANVLIENVDIYHTNATNNTRGVWIEDSTNVTLRNVDIVATTGGTDHEGAGILIEGDTSAVVLDGVTTTGHESFAGIALIPGTGSTISNVEIVGSTFNEVNKLTFDVTQGGAVTGLDAPMFVAAVGTTSPAYGAGDRFFYKTSVDRAILDSLFNFNETNTDTGLPSWFTATVQLLDPTDQSVRQNAFVVGSAFDTEYGFFATRSALIQAAIDVAANGATIDVQDGTYDGVPASAFASGGVTLDGAIVVDVPGITITGVGGASIVSAGATDPVFTIDADGVTLDGLNITGTAATGVLVGTGDLLTVSGSNLLNGVALDNTAEATVTATGNYWGAADGPSGDGPGTGGELIDPTAAVTFAPVSPTPIP